MDKTFYVDEECVIGFWVGEIGWFLQRYQGLLRYAKHNIHKDHKFILFCSKHLHPFVNDFVYASVELPQEFTNLKLETDCYESVIPGSPSGSLMPPNVYTALVEEFRTHYNADKAIEMFPPRGCNWWVDSQPQVFCQYKTDKILSEKPIIVVFPRARARASNRNIPSFVWYELVSNLQKHATVVLAGTPSGACLADYEGEGVINLISYNEPDKTEKIIKYLNSAQMSVSSQSGGTHISLLSGCPSYIIGHESERHSILENRLNVPVSFRIVQDYRAIDAYSIIQDMDKYATDLKESGWTKPPMSIDNLIETGTSELNSIIDEQRT
jgi:hypothetical protein